MNRFSPDPAVLPAIPRDDEGPVFAEPWQAEAFALAVELSQAGFFTWREWADALVAEIAAAGPDDPPEHYYEHWLTALEKLADAKGLTLAAERHARRDAWEEAALATPHGEAIVLGARAPHPQPLPPRGRGAVGAHSAPSPLGGEGRGGGATASEATS